MQQSSVFHSFFPINRLYQIVIQWLFEYFSMPWIINLVTGERIVPCTQWSCKYFQEGSKCLPRGISPLSKALLECKLQSKQKIEGQLFLPHCLHKKNLFCAFLASNYKLITLCCKVSTLPINSKHFCLFVRKIWGQRTAFACIRGDALKVTNKKKGKENTFLALTKLHW